MLVARHVAWESEASKALSAKRRAGWARFVARSGSPWAFESRLGVAGVDGASARAQRFGLAVLPRCSAFARRSSWPELGAATNRAVPRGVINRSWILGRATVLRMSGLLSVPTRCAGRAH